VETVTVAFEIHEGDLFRASAWMLFKKWYIATFYVLNGIALLYLLWALATRGFTTADLRGFVFPVIFLVIVPATLYWSSRSNVRSLQPGQRQHRYEFATDALRMNTGLSSAVVAWEAVHKVVETKSAFYVYLQKSICHVVPKRGVPTETDLGRLRALVATKLGSKARLRTGGC
jgi:hypothetical protein